MSTEPPLKPTSVWPSSGLDKLPLLTDNAHKLDVLGKSELCRGLSADELSFTAERLRTVVRHSGQHVYRNGETGRCMYLVAAGRVRVFHDSGSNNSQRTEWVGTPGHFGGMAVLGDDRRTNAAIAVVDTSLLELDADRFAEVVARIPTFAVNLARSLGRQLDAQPRHPARRHMPGVVAVVNSTLSTQGILPLIARALAGDKEDIKVLSDRAEPSSVGGEYQVELFRGGKQDEDVVRHVRRRLAQFAGRFDRVLLDLTQSGPSGEFAGVLNQCEEILWLVSAPFAESTISRLRALLVDEPHLAGRIHLVWVLRETERFSPRRPSDVEVAPLDFKVTSSDSINDPSRAARQGIGRIVRHLQRRRIGLALGGGGARGLAHLGALREFDSQGIEFDAVAGTSSGALMGLAYAGGWGPEDALTQLADMLTPNRLVRSLPGGNQWYMLTMFRTGIWRRMLRPYFGECCLTQLQVPLSMVAVDLVRGCQVIQQTGGVVDSLMESINLPVISRPIQRDGMALVDGGVLNNLPADVFSREEFDLIVGVDVVAKLPSRFAESSGRQKRVRRPSLLEVVFRLNEVRDYGLNEVRASGVDLMITPDTSEFEFADFSAAPGLADVGAAAAREAAPRLRNLIDEKAIASLPVRTGLR